MLRLSRSSVQDVVPRPSHTGGMTVRFDTKIAIAVRAVVRAVPAAELSFAGLAVHGPRNAVDKIFKGASLHP